MGTSLNLEISLDQNETLLVEYKEKLEAIRQILPGETDQKRQRVLQSTVENLVSQIELLDMIIETDNNFLQNRFPDIAERRRCERVQITRINTSTKMKQMWNKMMCESRGDGYTLLYADSKHQESFMILWNVLKLFGCGFLIGK